MSYVAAQTDWAQWCRIRLDHRIQRGRPKAETLISHLEVETFKDANSEARRRVDRVYAEALQGLEDLRQLIDGVKRIGLEAAHRDRINQFEVEAANLSLSFETSARGKN